MMDKTDLHFLIVAANQAGYLEGMGEIEIHDDQEFVWFLEDQYQTYCDMPDDGKPEWYFWIERELRNHYHK